MQASGHSTFGCVDDLCTHKHMKVAEIICQCGNSCSSSKEFLPSFGRNDQSTLGKLIHRCYHKVQEDVSRLGFRAGNCCQTHISTDGAPIHKPMVVGGFFHTQYCALIFCPVECCIVLLP